MQWWDELDIPKRLRDQLRGKFSVGRDGYIIWYRGKTRYACGKATPPEKVEDAWAAKRKAIDADLDNQPVPKKPGQLTYREVLSRFIDDCEHRVKTGKPRPMRERTLHNYDSDLNAFGNFIYQGRKVADLSIREANDADLFTAYGKTYGAWKASGFDSIISRVGTLFAYAEDKRYIDRYNPGPMFQRPAKSAIRDDRIDLQKSYTPQQIAKMYLAGNQTMKCLIGLGAAAAMNNSEASHLDRTEMNLAEGVIDFRRRKTGRVRRLIPLPADVLADLNAYVRPEPADVINADAFFLTRSGGRFCETGKRDGRPGDMIGRLWHKLEKAAGVPHVKGRSFSGLRTTFFNLAPGGEYELARKVIMGRAQGTIDLDHYLETLHLVRLRHVVDSVWNQIAAAISTERADSASRQPAAAVPSRPQRQARPVG
jgi:integrase